ncbi:hypothetical protein BaRGS_00035417 [Batillaria attramentaria]|uniref:RNA helicase n=1 Tax=Batillaria attramentaria TaxID=370345 RepID=A0ABD0JF23_9CAEN
MSSLEAEEDDAVLGAVGGLDLHGQMERPNAEEDDALLRSALLHLQPFLGQIGLSPVRVVTYMRWEPAYQHFPNTERFRNIRHLENRDDVQTAASSFVDDLLDENAPSGILPHFMRSLRRANDDEGHPNEGGAWHTHDVVTLACVYMPVQEAVCSLFTEDSAQDHIQNVVSALSERRLLTPDNLAHVLETLESDGGAAASIRMLAFLYKIQAERARQEFARVEGRPEETEASEEGSERRPVWLEVLLDLVERHGGQGVRQTIPAGLLTSEVWTGALDDDASVAGRTVVGSEVTLTDHEEGQGHQHGDDEQPRGPVLPESLNVDSIKLERTIEFIRKSRGAQEQMPYIIEFIGYERRRIVRDQRRQSQEEVQSELSDESSSVVTSVGTASTEDNTRARELDMESREFARTLRYTGLSEGEEGDPERIRLRAYQEELLLTARDGKNVVILLPTGTGKTFIVIKYVQEYLSKPGLGRVVFLAPKVKLAEQQYRRFQHFFPKTTYFRCGRSRSSTAPFRELLDTYRVYVMTPMCLVEAVRAGEVQIPDFSLMVLDECHHTLGKHPYKDLMDLYMDAKFSADMPRLPQIIGLTASPRVGPGGTVDSAVGLLRELCYNMDVEKLCTVVRNERELERYVNEPTHEIHRCKKRLKEGFKGIVERMMKTIEEKMIRCIHSVARERQQHLKAVLTAPEYNRGEHRYTQWVTNLTTKLVNFADEKKVYTQLFSQAEMLLRYQRALILNEDCESKYALDYLTEQARLVEEPGNITQTERQMLADFQRQTPQLKRACEDPEDYNPKLGMLEDVLCGIIEKHQDEASCMVFVRTLELSKAIQQWMKDHPVLQELEPGRITGSRKSVFHGGMTRLESEDVMKGFNAGKHKVVVCTSAAEEGLDFQACNIVVRYDYVTSMVAMIQTRGRARRMDSQYVVMGHEAKGNVDKERENLASERLMRQAVTRMQQNMDDNPNAFRGAMDRNQKSQWTTRQLAEEAKRRQARRMQETQDSGDRYDLLCRKCQQKACSSTDIRLYASSSRVVIKEDFRRKWKRVERAYDNEIYQDLEKVAKVHCNNKDENGDDCSFDWGCLVKYIPSGREYPVLKLESFFLVDTRTGQRHPRKLKWGKAPFTVKPLTEDEIGRL